MLHVTSYVYSKYVQCILFFHFSPRFELPAYQQHDINQKDLKKLVVICHFCGDTGHKAMYCHKMVSDLVKIKPELEINEQPQVNSQTGFARKLKPLEEVTCYKVFNTQIPLII